MTLFRAIGSLLIALGLVLAPSAAFADHEQGHYGGGGAQGEVIVTDSNPEPCEPFTVIVEAPGTATVTLTATHTDGTTRSWTEDTVGGAAEFTISLCKEGSWRLVAENEDGEVLGVSMVRVGDGTAGDGDDDGGTDDGGGFTLPDTGSASSTLLLTGSGVLLLAGGVLLLTRRRMTAGS